MAKYISRGAISLVAGGKMLRFAKGVSDYEFSTEDAKKIATLDYYAKRGIIRKVEEAQPDAEPMLALVTEDTPVAKPSAKKKKKKSKK